MSCFFTFRLTSLTTLISDNDLSNPSDGRQVDDGREKDSILGAKSNKDEGHNHFEEEDGPWYLGKAKEEFHKRQSQPVLNRREEDPIQVCSPDTMISMSLMTIIA